jgi:biotin synthase-like enzyme
MEKKILDTAWRSFAEQVVPLHASDLQRREMRRVFMAGAQALMTGILEMLDPGHEPTESDLYMMDSVATELNDFARDVVQGRA